VNTPIAKPPPQRTTVLLALLVLSAAAACIAVWLWSSSQRDAARLAAQTLASARRDIHDIAAMRQSPGRSVAQSLDTPAVTARIRRAAQAAGLAEPSSLEPGPATRLGTTDYTETPVYLGFEPLTLKQLVTFLQHLSRLDPGVRAKQIELSTPQSGTTPAPGQGEELWQADIAIGYLTYSPRK
jgi:hypothetical protein